MSFELDHLPLHPFLGGPDSHSVKPGDLLDPIHHVEGLHPLVYPGHLLNPVDIGGGSGPVVGVPHKLWCREKGGNSKGVLLTWVEVILVGHVILKSLNFCGEGLVVPTLDKVIKTSNEQDSHGPADPAVLSPPGKEQVLHLGSWDCHPVNVRTVWWTNNSWIPGLVEVVEGAVREADVQPVGHGHPVCLLAGGAQILPVSGGVLHTLQDPNLASRPVVVVHGDWRSVLGLLVGAYLALRVPVAGAVGHRRPRL